METLRPLFLSVLRNDTAADQTIRRPLAFSSSADFAPARITQQRLQAANRRTGWRGENRRLLIAIQANAFERVGRAQAEGCSERPEGHAAFLEEKVLQPARR